MENTLSTVDLIKKRISWRSYGERALELEKKEKIIEFINELETPYWGNMPRFDFVDVGPAGKGRMTGTYGMIKGAGTFLVGAVKKNHCDMEDFGYIFEKIILFVTRLNLNTCWIGLTVSRKMLADKINLQENEAIPAVTPLGYSTKRRSLVDTLTRASIGASKRKPWKAMFFDGTWGSPLNQSAAGNYSVPLEMVRLAPSSTNKQPWRIVREKGVFHFFLQRSAGYSKMTSAADLQRIDMGIAMCHFESAAKELSLSGDWAETKYSPTIILPKRCEYLVSWIEK